MRFWFWFTHLGQFVHQRPSLSCDNMIRQFQCLSSRMRRRIRWVITRISKREMSETDVSILCVFRFGEIQGRCHTGNSNWEWFICISISPFGRDDRSVRPPKGWFCYGWQSLTALGENGSQRSKKMRLECSPVLHRTFSDIFKTAEHRCYQGRYTRSRPLLIVLRFLFDNFLILFARFPCLLCVLV